MTAEKKTHNQAWPFPTNPRDHEDMAHPRCYRCGHTFYDRPMEMKVHGKALDGGLCNWCWDEVHGVSEEK